MRARRRAGVHRLPGPVRVPGLSDGDHTLLVRAVDLTGTPDSSPASWSWTVNADRTAPTTTILYGPEQPETTLFDASFGFVSNEPGSTFECALDAEPLAPCESPMEYTVELGDHVFRVRATDLNGNVETPVSYPWSVILDTVPPETTLHARPPLTTTDTTATVQLLVQRVRRRVRVLARRASLSSGCSSPEEYTELLPGVHTFEVRAVDLAEPTPNVDGSPEFYTWTIEGEPDTTPPETTHPVRPAGDDGEHHRLHHVLLRGRGHLRVPARHRAGRRVQLADGVRRRCRATHVFTVWATDIFLNVETTPAEHRWTVVAPPETTIGDAPAATSDTNRATFTFSSDQQGGRFFCDIDGLGFTLCTSPVTYTGLIDGTHTFEVAAQNEYGLTDETPALHEWIVAVPPDTFILNAPEPTTDSTSTFFTFNASEEATFECSLDSEPFAECESPVFYPDIDLGTPPLTVGPHTFEVRATDSEGNIDASPAIHRWTVVLPPDNTPPETSIGFGPPTSTTDTSATFEFTSSEQGSTFECALDAEPYLECESPTRARGPADRPTHVQHPRDRPVGEPRRHAGNLQLDRRVCRRHCAADDYRLRPADEHARHVRHVHLLVQRDRLDVRVHARRFDSNAVRIGDDADRSIDRRAHIRGRGNRCSREPRRDAGHPHMDRRRGSADHY